ncbi:MAG: beta-eliminating lyase-related protein, partial [Pantoea sp.]|nr:beta-eliminating lyase-related protein [Pantoea sp.]
ERARRWRKMTGGGMRQAGILAAAGLYALQHNVTRLQQDHDNAAWLGQQLHELGVEVIDQQTNMLFVQLPANQVEPLAAWMKARDVLISAGPRTRLVTHLDADRAALEQVVANWKAFLQQ